MNGKRGEQCARTAEVIAVMDTLLSVSPALVSAAEAAGMAIING